MRSPRPSRDPFQIAPTGSLLAPVLAAIGLVVVAVATLAVFSGTIPLPGGGGSGGGGNGGGGGGGGNVIVANRTPAPSNVVVVDPRTNIPGTLVYVKQGNLWTQTGNKATQITTSGAGSMPSWSPDGQWIYYIESVHDQGYFPGGNEGPAHYTMEYPVLTRIHPDGTGAQKLLSGRYRQGQYTWFFWIRQPRVSPDGRTVAIVSDGPDPTKSDVVMQTYDVKTDKTRRLGLAENPPLGHQDPAWRPDGKLLLYVRNGRNGTTGAPVIYRYDPASKKNSPFSPPGYMQPAWSPDGRWVAVTKTSTLGTDIAILDAKTGNEVLRLTNDGQSWSPIWSPKGDSIVYMNLAGQIVDLKEIGLTGDGPTWTTKQLPDVTQYSGLDGGSAASWYIPGFPVPTTSPAPAASAAPTANPSGSSAP